MFLGLFIYIIIEAIVPTTGFIETLGFEDNPRQCEDVFDVIALFSIFTSVGQLLVSSSNTVVQSNLEISSRVCFPLRTDSFFSNRLLFPLLLSVEHIQSLHS